MEHSSLERRVEILEQKVELLQDLPARMTAVEGRLTAVEGRLTAVEAQIVQLRYDMNNGFSALSYAINRMVLEILSRFEKIDRRFDAMEERFHQQGKELAAIRQRLE
jgi:uncharacterized coiled-coil protein SlyX